jgi:hypothetical protein
MKSSADLRLELPIKVLAGGSSTFITPVTESVITPHPQADRFWLLGETGTSYAPTVGKRT